MTKKIKSQEKKKDFMIAKKTKKKISSALTEHLMSSFQNLRKRPIS